jgi:MSHA biogenesis protein MshL
MLLTQTIRLCLLSLILTACHSQPIQPNSHHLERNDPAAILTDDIPPTLKNNVILAAPRRISKTATYSVVVANLPAQEILFALARDANINLDIHGGIEGNITLNALNQTLPQILERIAKQVEMRYEINHGTLTVMPDSPYLHSYKIDYVNMNRDAEGGISNATQVGNGAGGASASAGNNSQLAIKNSSHNHFWETLIKNVTDILRETDKILPEGSSETLTQQIKLSSSTGTGAPLPTGSKKSQPKIGVENSPNPVNVEEGDTTVTKRSTFREAAAVIANPEAGIISVRATSKQHEKIEEFISRVMTNAHREVLIEMTVAQVELNDSYQQGINWGKIIPMNGKGWSIGQAGATLLPTSATAATGALILNYTNLTSKFGSLVGSVSLLETFGKVKVLSSPKISVVNNQTAMLRVVENFVYFTIKSETTTNQTSSITTYTTTPNTIPVGLSMSITPQISDHDTVLLNVRPSITRFIKMVDDPNPSLKNAGVLSQIPQTQTREMESVIKIGSNQIAVMGGLMEDEVNKTTTGIPLLMDLPLLGNLFKNISETTRKTELVIFLHPVVIKNPSLATDYSDFRDSLPDQDFFQEATDEKTRRLR